MPIKFVFSALVILSEIKRLELLFQLTMSKYKFSSAFDSPMPTKLFVQSHYNPPAQRSVAKRCPIIYLYGNYRLQREIAYYNLNICPSIKQDKLY